jgi:hypothetical protein
MKRLEGKESSIYLLDVETDSNVLGVELHFASEEGKNIPL